MFGNREVHRKLSGTGGYAAGRLAEISESLGQLAKVMKNSGEDPGLSREDGIAALESAASMVCGSCDPLWHETGMPGGSGRGELFSLLSASLFREKGRSGISGHAQGVPGPVPEENGLSAGIK